MNHVTIIVHYVFVIGIEFHDRDYDFPLFFLLTVNLLYIIIMNDI